VRRQEKLKLLKLGMIVLQKNYGKKLRAAQLIPEILESW
jgi:hypothetical protein